MASKAELDAQSYGGLQQMEVIWQILGQGSSISKTVLTLSILPGVSLGKQAQLPHLSALFRRCRPVGMVSAAAA